MELNLTDADLDKLSPQDLQALMDENEAALSDQAAEFIMKRHELNNKRWAAGEFDDGSGQKRRALSRDMHPNLSKWDRFVAKNLTKASPDTQIGYLKQEYPDMEFDTLPNGEVIARGEDDVEWHRLDEDGFSLMDIADHTADVGLGIAENGIGLAAGMASANPVVGMAARAGAGYLGEGLRQTLGSLAGVPNNFDQKEALTSGTLSAAIPVVGDSMIKPAWGWIKNTAAPVVGEYLSGINRDILRNVNLDEHARQTIQSMGIDEYTTKLSNAVKNGLHGARFRSGKDIENNLSDQPINFTPIAQRMDAELNNLNPKLRESYSYLRGLLPENQAATGHNVGQPMSYMVSPRQAINAKNDLYTIAAGDKTPLGFNATQAVTNDLSPIEMDIARNTSTAARDLLKSTSKDPVAYDQLASKHSDIINVIADKRLKPLNDKLGTRKYLQTWGKNKTPGEDDIDRTLVDKVRKYTGGEVDLDQAGRQYQSWQYFQDPSMSPQGKWYQTGAGGAVGGGIGGAISYGMGMGAGPGIALTLGGGVLGGAATSPWAMKKMGQAGKRFSDNAELGRRMMYDNNLIRGDKALYNTINSQMNR